MGKVLLNICFMQEGGGVYRAFSDVACPLWKHALGYLGISRVWIADSRNCVSKVVLLFCDDIYWCFCGPSVLSVLHLIRDYSKTIAVWYEALSCQVRVGCLPSFVLLLVSAGRCVSGEFLYKLLLTVLLATFWDICAARDYLPSQNEEWIFLRIFWCVSSL